MENTFYQESLAYQNYLQARDYMNIGLDKFVNECVILKEEADNLYKLSILNEGFMETLKSFFEKFKQFFQKIWNKFIEATDKLIKDNKAYLDKYKETILNKKNPNIEVQMFDYPKGLPTLIQFQIVPFNWAKTEAVAKKKLEENVDDIKRVTIGEYYPSLVNGVSKGDDWIALLSAKFRGADSVDGAVKKTFNLKDLNVTDMFNFCYDYTKTTETLEKNKKVVTAQADAAMNAITNKLNEISQKNNSTAQGGEEKTDGQTNADQNADNPPADGQEGSKQNPVDVDKAKDDNKEEEKDNSVKPAASSDAPSKAAQMQDRNDVNNPAGKANTDNVSDDKTGKAYSDAVQEYINMSRDIITSQMTVSESIVKTYMNIIRLKVKHYMGNPADANNTDNNQAKTNGTNYKNNNTADANGGNKQQQAPAK